MLVQPNFSYAERVYIAKHLQQMLNKTPFGTKKYNHYFTELSNIVNNTVVSDFDTKLFKEIEIDDDIVKHLREYHESELEVFMEIPVNSITHANLFIVNDPNSWNSDQLWLANPFAPGIQSYKDRLKLVSEFIVCEKPHNVDKIVVNYMDTDITKVDAIKANGGYFKCDMRKQWYKYR